MKSWSGNLLLECSPISVSSSFRLNTATMTDVHRAKLFHTKVAKVATKTDIITFSATTNVGTALQVSFLNIAAFNEQTLIQKNIYSAPVKSEKTGHYLGFIDLLDIVTWITGKISSSRR